MYMFQIKSEWEAEMTGDCGIVLALFWFCFFLTEPFPGLQEYDFFKRAIWDIQTCLFLNNEKTITSSGRKNFSAYIVFDMYILTSYSNINSEERLILHHKHYWIVYRVSYPRPRINFHVQVLSQKVLKILWQKNMEIYKSSDMTESSRTPTNRPCGETVFFNCWICLLRTLVYSKLQYKSIASNLQQFFSNAEWMHLGRQLLQPIRNALVLVYL